MSATVKDLPGGLFEEVKENGENLSQGQKQLLCIARALLRKTRVLVVDEGTSAVDPFTDELIQRVLRTEADQNGTTVLAIAHRLQTIVDFDKILVLGNGNVLEFGSPKDLLADSNSNFSQMMSETHQ
jgi:ABC-type multidrug transport system fused ATPase/permease subunit